jgi:cytochrome c oxidase subunit 3
MSSHHDPDHYYVPAQSPWPIVGAIGLFLFAIGAAHLIHAFKPDSGASHLSAFLLLGAGVAVIIFMVSGWFNHVIKESMSGLYSAQMDRSFRWGMLWFIFSEVMFFAAFFGALFYIRTLSVPWLGGMGAKELTGTMLWPDFTPTWPLLINPSPTFPGPKEVMPAQGIPLINTLILLTSGITCTWAHWALKKNYRKQLNWGLFATVALGTIFLGFQIYEYSHAYHELGLTLDSGVYGSTFFMLTGFHGMHVTLGSIMLLVILLRCMKGHFTKDHHFAFEATAWYWHFVDVVWLGLFIFVYVL